MRSLTRKLSHKTTRMRKRIRAKANSSNEDTDDEGDCCCSSSLSSSSSSSQHSAASSTMMFSVLQYYVVATIVLCGLASSSLFRNAAGARHQQEGVVDDDKRGLRVLGGGGGSNISSSLRSRRNSYIAPISPDVPFGDVNVLVLTDVHSWIAGHGAKEPNLDADYGHVLSFYQRLKHHCNTRGKDLWFVMNGDWIDGTGLAMNGDPSYLIPLLLKMPWDAVNVGNHELYRNEVIDYMSRPGGFVEWWGNRMLTSNVAHAHTQLPVGNNYRLLRGVNGTTVLAFGFLYDMDNAADHVIVKTVENVVHNEPWFESAVKADNYDAILVLAHMNVRDGLVEVILNRIRQLVGDDMPVQFVTGHTHHRDFSKLDNSSVSFEAGRYLDTVGFVSFPTKETYHQQRIQHEQQLASTSSSPSVGVTNSSNRTISTAVSGTGHPSSLFRHVFMDASVKVLTDTLGGVETLYTQDGKELSKYIERTREELGLKEKVGCLKGAFYLNRSLHDADSVWKLWRETVVPSKFEERDVVLMDNGGWRYDLIGDGDVHVDDLIAVSPFNESYVAFQDIPGGAIVKLNRTLNDPNITASNPDLPFLPEFVMAPARLPFQPQLHNVTYNLLVPKFLSTTIQTELSKVLPNTTAVLPPPVQLSTTTTEVWLAFFRGHRGCVTGGGHHIGWGSGSGSSSPFGFDISVSADEEDRVRIALALVAVLVVVSLAAVAVKQRGTIFQRIVDEREHATLSALQEADDHADADEDYDDEETEGYFL